MDSFLQQMLQLRDGLGTIASSFNVPNVNSVYIRRKINNGYETERIVPDPWVSDVNFELKNVADLQALKGMTRVLSIKGVSLTYPRSILQGENITYEVNREGQTLLCKLIQLKDNGLTWELTVEQRIGEQSIYGIPPR